jgi:two-component system chemotaxis sensor kinase CheA
MSESNDDIVKEFLVESYENLDQLDRDFVALEKEPGSRELLGGVFRTIHTIKGTCGFLGFHRLEAVTHAGESVLSLLRDGTLSLDPRLTSDLLAMVDAVREMLDSIESRGIGGNETYDAVIEKLQRAQAAAPP